MLNFFMPTSSTDSMDHSTCYSNWLSISGMRGLQRQDPVDTEDNERYRLYGLFLPLLTTYIYSFYAINRRNDPYNPYSRLHSRLEFNQKLIRWNRGSDLWL
jgi:hypothetical protein